MNAPGPVAAPLLAAIVRRLAMVAGAAGEAATGCTLPPVNEAAFARAANALALGEGERLAILLALAVEADAAVARLVARAQQPVGGARLLAGLLASLLHGEGLTPLALAAGRAVAAGLLDIGDEAVPLPERSLSMPAPVAAALSGHQLFLPGARPLPRQTTPLAGRQRDEAAALAALAGPRSLVVLRAPSPREGEAMAAVIAATLGLAAVDLTGASHPRPGGWLLAAGALPVLCQRPGPGEKVDLGAFDEVPLPLLVVGGAEGHFESARQRVEWRATMPTEDERRALWRAGGLPAATARRAAQSFRHGAGRIAELAERLPARDRPQEDQPQEDRSWAGLVRALGEGAGRLDQLARRLPGAIERAHIVLTPALDAALDGLRDRIRLRNRLADGLGPTLRARYRPGVRALFTGDSGTGKTLAAHWLAHEAGLPLYRADLARLTSKWIGETEKNLSELLDAAEDADVMLFFDEADSLFGARTEVGDAHDRFANAQTNFLLQRIEEFDGVAILATNSRDRFDPAFVRRLDSILEFPLPDAMARHRLWQRHLGDAAMLEPRALDLLASEVDLAGGHIRNIVLAAAVRARAQERAICLADLRAAAAEEYRKLGRAAPAFSP